MRSGSRSSRACKSGIAFAAASIEDFITTPVRGDIPSGVVRIAFLVFGALVASLASAQEVPHPERIAPLVARERKCSTSFIQRHLQIGYNRAARIVERMESEGVVGAANHVGKREVLAPKGDYA